MSGSQPHNVVFAGQANPDKLQPEWEEMAATSCAVQNMWLQGTALGLAGQTVTANMLRHCVCTLCSVASGCWHHPRLLVCYQGKHQKQICVDLHMQSLSNAAASLCVFGPCLTKLLSLVLAQLFCGPCWTVPVLYVSQCEKDVPYQAGLS